MSHPTHAFKFVAHLPRSLFENDSNLAHERKTFVPPPPLFSGGRREARKHSSQKRRCGEVLFLLPSSPRDPPRCRRRRILRTTDERRCVPGKEFWNPSKPAHWGRRRRRKTFGGTPSRHESSKEEAVKHLHMSLLPFSNSPPFPAYFGGRKEFAPPPHSLLQ